MINVSAGECVATREFSVDAVDLFFFSAACWLPHRIHFDPEFARSEGLKTVAVHGPLQAAWLVHLVSEWAGPRGARLASTVVRHVEPAYPGETLRATVTVTSVEQDTESPVITMDLRLTKPDGALATVGTARVVAEREARS